MAAAMMRAFFSRPIEDQIINVTVEDQFDLIDAILQEMRQPSEEQRRAFYEDNYGDVELIWECLIDAAISDRK